MTPAEIQALRAFLYGYDPAALYMDESQLKVLLATVVKKGGAR